MFVRVVESGSFYAVARETDVGQPAVSYTYDKTGNLLGASTAAASINCRTQSSRSSRRLNNSNVLPLPAQEGVR